MRRIVRPPRRQITINLTPLIDVVINLVIFFLVVSQYANNQPSETLLLPEATQSQADDRVRLLTVSVRADGTYVVAGEVAELATIDNMIAEGAGENPDEFSVRVRGDRSAQFSAIRPLMAACAAHGVTSFGFNVLPSAGEAGKKQL